MFWLTTVLALGLAPLQLLALICSRYPANTFVPQSKVDENFVLSVAGNPQSYILGQSYNVMALLKKESDIIKTINAEAITPIIEIAIDSQIQALNGEYYDVLYTGYNSLPTNTLTFHISLQAFNGLRFISFKLALENENGNAAFHQNLGHFEISDTIESRFSPNCINMVENTNTNPKTRVDVSWVAPEQSGNGCVLIRATLLQHRDVWYMDDGGLTKRLCEETVDDVESSTKDMSQSECCACDEARYEVVFEGTWSRNHHPKHFPTKGWTTRFGDIVGAAHTADYRFWEYGQLATEAIKELAEHGSAKSLEREFNYNFKNGKIRTIIKARGPAFPNLAGQSVASIRVDPQHHLLSLASKIDPSPDWIVGVSGLELCMINCTWLEQKAITLYPWDVGTDAGPSYTSADQPQVPADVIRRMRSDFPNDPRSPFYDETGAPMKPLAILKIRRQRLYERLCDDGDSNNLNIARECFTHPWSAWSSCSVRCGEGRQHRKRVYKQPEVARIYNCDVEVRQDRGCVSRDCANENTNFFFTRQDLYEADDKLFDNDSNERMMRAECQLTGWGSWSECSKTCGEGKTMRRRQYLNPSAEEKCQNARFLSLAEVKKCFGSTCLGEINARDNNNGRQPVNVEDENDQMDRNDKYNLDTRYHHHNWSNKDENRYENQIKFSSEEEHENDKVSQSNAADNTYRPSYNPVNDYGSYAKTFESTRNSEEHGTVLDSNEFGGSRKEPVNLSYNYGYENQIHRPQEKIHYTNTNGRNTFGDGEDQDEREVSEIETPSYCYEQLKIFTCLDGTVVGNFWFYNYCANECMLYAADSCDQNKNKFTSLEMCEQRCRQSNNSSLLRKKQSQSCFRQKQSRKSRRRYGGNFGIS